jgi:drug/metabolite transporter (DMT)-like permease
MNTGASFVVPAGNGGILWPSLAMLASTLFWGTMWIGLREIGAAGVPATLGGTLVYGLPAILLLPVVLFRWQRVRADARGLLLCAAPLALCNILFAMAVVMGEIGMIILMFYLSPIWSTLLERILLKVSISPLRWAGIALALIGLLVLQGGHGRMPWPSNVAEWMGLVAGFCWAIALLTARMWPQIPVLDKSVLQFVCALPIGLIVFFVVDVTLLPATWPENMALLAAMPWIFATFLLWVVPSLTLSLWGAARLSPGRANILMMFEVVVGVGSGALLAGEDLGWNKILGAVLIVSASILESWQATREAKSAKENRAAA